MYNCKSDTVSPTDDDDIVMSVTVFPEKRMTFAVMYGCTKSTMKNVGSYLKRLKTQSNLSIFHPLILPMVFTELERKRLLNVLERKTSELGQRILVMQNRLKEDEQKTTSHQDSGVTLAAREMGTTELWRSVSAMKNGLASLKTQLVSMNAHCSNLSQTSLKEGIETDECRTERESGGRIQVRIQDIIDEFDSKIRHCDNLLGGTELATQMVSR